MEAKRLDLKVDEEFRRLCPAMGKETRQELERLLSGRVHSTYSNVEAICQKNNPN